MSNDSTVSELADLLDKKLTIKSNKNVCMKLQTEDTGKMFEMAICMAYNIPYVGKYKYSLDLCEKLQPRLANLTKLFPLCTHTAENRSQYDFTAIEDKSEHLSAKTVKKGAAKVAPQIIGQATPLKFCAIIGICYTTDEDLKQYMQENISNVLKIMSDYTFDCPNIYYHQQKDTIKYIKLTEQINWSSYKYEWTRDYKIWNNSSVCKIITPTKSIPIAEFQFHSKNRKNLAIRWFYDNVLLIFKDLFDITDL